MKKSVAIVLLVIFAALSFYNGYKAITGLQIIELPAPPSPPGMGEAEAPVPQVPSPPQDQVQPTPTAQPAPTAAPAPRPRRAAQAPSAVSRIPSGTDTAAILARLDAIEQIVKLLPGWEERLILVETQAALASDVVARLDAMQSQIDALQIAVDNLKPTKPFIDEPTFFDNLRNVQGSVKRNAILSISLSVLALLIVISMIASGIAQRKKVNMENKNLIRQYLMNYQKAGYKLETLRMHLRASGWKDEVINEALKELPK